jgi:6-phosphogluconolactonase
MILPYTADTVADLLASTLDEAALLRGRATLAVPGGRSPAAVLTQLSRILPPRLRAQVHLCWVDERAVPVGHADRNDTPILAAWQAGGPLPGGVHAMPAEHADLDAAAAAYTATLTELEAHDGFDAVLLGLGEDGHVASLFPGHDGLDELSPVFVIRDSPKPPAQRLSVSLAVLRGSGQVAVLALGAAKSTALAHVVGKPDRWWPASLLDRARTQIFADDNAINGP